ncbi:MAG: DMT family transporter [Marivibrio sp.]|uniref:DMT family transporter n=1 Tax=Marivibrio sp. TaxID=2039719 RepID=UPI0032EACC6C
MQDEDRTTAIASAIVVASGVLWGIYWLPIREIEAAGLPGAWGTLAAVAAAAAALAPFAILRRRALARTNRWGLFYVALGGASFVLYSVGFIYGRVAIIILLFYLTPVWSVLIGRYVLGWRSTAARTAAIGLGLVGLVVMLGADGQTPLPRNVGEWLALAAGLLWSIASTGIRLKSDLDVVVTSFVFALGGCAGALIVAIGLASLAAPSLATHAATAAPALAPLPAIAWSLVAGLGWWGANTAMLLWATARLEPAKVGILLMSEVVVGALSGAFIAGEALSALEWGGGVLVLGAALLEIRGGRRKPA